MAEGAFSYVVCLDNSGYPASLEVRKIYRRISDARAEADGLMRVIDESGEDYLSQLGGSLPSRFPTQLRRPSRAQARLTTRSS
jgi:hypothetical protein